MRRLRTSINAHPGSRYLPAHFRAMSLVLSLLVLVVSALATATPASAAIPGLVRVEVLSPSNSLNKSVTATCPAGTLVVGAGGTVTGGGGKVIIDEIKPQVGLQSVLVTGYENDTTYAINWHLAATIHCAPSASVPGLVRVQATSPSDSLNKSVIANCPAGKILVGGGAGRSQEHWER